jgi:hypothetical protein
LILLLAVGGIAYANDSFIMDGPDVVGVTSTPLTWSMIALAGLAILTIFGALRPLFGYAADLPFMCSSTS